MSSEAISAEPEDEDSSCGLLLRDIEQISKALYLDKGPFKPFSSSQAHRPNEVPPKLGILKSKSSNSVTVQDLTIKDKKSSLWNWRPLKALAHIRNHRLSCYFFLHVHTIQGLPPNFDGLDLSVTWSRKNDESGTQPSRACLGVAEFEETLMHRCTVYGSSRTGPAKYEAKIFSLRVSVVGRPSNTEIGNHLIDLSRLLPLSVEELDWNNKNNMGISGKWATSFKLTGEAKGANLNVSFGFSLLDGNSFEPGCFVKVPDISGFDNLGSFPRISTNDLHGEIFPKQESELSDSVNLLYSKLNEFSGGKNGHEHSDPDFDIIEQGIEFPTNDQIKIESIDVAEIFDSEDTDFHDYVEKNSKIIENHEEKKYAIDEEYVLAFNDMLASKPAEDSLHEEYLSAFYDMLASKPVEDSLPGINNSTESRLISDDVSESIENDFLNMLTVDQIQDDFDLPFPIQSVGESHDAIDQLLRRRSNVKLLENLETEALMHEWGFTEKAFQYSPHNSPGGFGSPVYIPVEEPLRLPSIEEGVGPMIRTREGGFLRSMSPLIFANAINGAKLIVQVSSPVVLPPAMGFTVMEILLCWASVGFENMCALVNELMPLEDVTGKTMRDVLSGGESGSDGLNRGAFQLDPNIDTRKKTSGHQPLSQCSENASCSDSGPIDSDYVSCEDLVPMALANIEGLLIQGLKIHSGMPDQEAPSSSEDTSCLPVFDIDELMKNSMSLDEWIQLDSSKNFKMGFKVQLRDPFRNYEMVGSPMLALVQVDSVVYSARQENEFCGPMFKVSEVQLAGLNGGDKEVWGTSRQKQSGTRWLFSSGMAKSNNNNKNPISDSSGVVKYSKNGFYKKAWHGDVLWSICSTSGGEAGTWDERVALNVHVRNPDIIFSK